MSCLSMGDARERIYFDGECGLCHRWVRFAMKRDRDGSRFRYAPLSGPTFAADASAAERRALPDSLAVRTQDGRLLVRSTAVLHVMKRLGGGWGAFAGLLGLVPRPLRDLGYDGVARARKRLFRKPEGLCPLVPPELGRRFDP